MQRRVMVAALVVAAVITAGGVWYSRGTAGASVAASVAGDAPFSELADRDIQIRVWHQALDADPTSALVLGQLAALHAQRAREGGTWDDYLQAEAYARRSIGKRNIATARPR